MATKAIHQEFSVEHFKLLKEDKGKDKTWEIYLLERVLSKDQISELIDSKNDKRKCY